MLSWLADDDDCPAPGPATWQRLEELFDEEADGYLRFRRSLLRDAAYEGLPYKLRRRLHGAVAARLEEELDDPEESAGILSLALFRRRRIPLRRGGTRALGAERAREVYAYVEAAGLYSRALDAARRLPDAESRQIAAMQEARADCWYRLGEYDKASEGYAGACRLVVGDRLAEGKLLLMRSLVEHKLGRYPRALRWCARARIAVTGLDEAGARRLAAQTTSWYAVVLQAEGRTKDALRWAERAVDEAQAADDAEALGDAYAVMGWAFNMLGREGVETLFQRSLKAYERSGNLVRQATLLSDLGVVSQWEGRWDDALSYYERSRAELLKVGDAFTAAVTRANVAEILIDRGDYAEAEELLLETLPLFKAAHNRFFLGFCLWFLGRALLRAGRIDQARKRLEEAKSTLESIGAGAQLPGIDATLAELHVFAGDPDAALDLANRRLAEAGSSSGLASALPLLKRVRAHALLQRGDRSGARKELDASLAAARARRDLFEITRTLLSMIELDRRDGVEPSPEWIVESEALVATLRIRVLPPMPPPARQA